MTLRKKFNFGVLFAPVLTFIFLLNLRLLLLRDSVIPGALMSNTASLSFGLIFITALMVIGCIYSIVTDARIQSYICAVCMLMGISLAYQFLFPGFQKHMLLLLVGSVVGIATYLIYRRINTLNKPLFILCSAAVVILLAANLLFGKAGGTGANNWLIIAGTSLQPSEFVKVLLVLLGASSFNNTKRSIIFCALCVLSCGVFLMIKDLGAVAVVFALLVVMVYLLFDEPLPAVGIIVVAILGLYVGIKVFPYASERFGNTFHALTNEDSFQQKRYIIGILLGGLKGLGVEHARFFTDTFAAENDGALVGILAVYGVPVLIITLLIYAFLSSQAAFNKSVHSSAFLLNTQLGVYLLSQTLLNFLGASDTAPFTGICAPLISSGGSSALATFMLLGLGAAALNPHVPTYERE